MNGGQMADEADTMTTLDECEARLRAALGTPTDAARANRIMLADAAVPRSVVTVRPSTYLTADIWRTWPAHAIVRHMADRSQTS